MGNATLKVTPPDMPSELKKGRYKVVRQLGEGGFGITWLATTEGTTVVVKQLKDRSDPQVVAMFRREFDTAKRLKEKHPTLRIPKVYEYWEESNKFWFSMEFINGELVSEIAFTETQMWQLAYQLLQILEVFRDENVIHRDIKPDNLIKYNGNFYLLDLGICKQLTESTRVGSTVIGTPLFSAPEVLVGGSCLRSDLYSLGVTLLVSYLGVRLLQFQTDYNPPDQFPWTFLRWAIDVAKTRGLLQQSSVDILKKLIAPEEGRYHTPQEVKTVILAHFPATRA